MTDWLTKTGRRQVAALLIVALIAAGVLAILNRRNNADVFVAADAPADNLGSAAVPEDPDVTPDVATSDVTETPTTPPPSTPSPTPTSSTEDSQPATTSTSPQPPPPKTATTPQLSASTTTTPPPAPSTTSPSSQPVSRTITISTTPREAYTEILVSGDGCAGERYGVNLEIRDSTGEPIDGDGASTAPDGSWQLEQRWNASKAAGRYTFHARCIHSLEEGGQTKIFEYEPKTFDWTGQN